LGEAGWETPLLALIFEPYDDEYPRFVALI